MNVKYINPFIKASEFLFREYLELDLEVGSPYLIDDGSGLNEVSGIIGLAGDTTGAVVLTISRKTSIELVSLFAKHNYKFLSNEVLDGVGEIVNIIAGNSKKYFDNYKISISLPGVVTGKEYNIHWPENIPIIGIPFISQLGKMSLNVSLKDKL